MFELSIPHPGSHQKEEARRRQVGHQPGNKGQGIVIKGKSPTPVLTGWVLLGHEVVGVVQSHQDNNQPPLGIQGN